MRQIQDLTGKVFGRLTVIGRDFSKKYDRVYWNCKCNCGTCKSIQTYLLKSGKTKSCGCLRREITSVRSANSKHHVTHGLSKHRLYKTYTDMKQRCNNKNNKNFHNYGGRGITICKEWLDDFEAFFNWSINNGYNDSLTIDRIDNNGNYDPNNCRWVTMKEQNLNRRSNHFIEYKGEFKTLKEWADEYDINSGTLYSRIVFRKWSIEKALNTPVDTFDYFEYNGKTKTIYEWATEKNIKKNTLWNRIYLLGWSIEKALNTPVKNNHFIEYKGTIKTITEWAKEYGLSHSLLRHRIYKQKMSVEQALTTPLKRKKNIHK